MGQRIGQTPPIGKFPDQADGRTVLTHTIPEVKIDLNNNAVLLTGLTYPFGQTLDHSPQTVPPTDTRARMNDTKVGLFWGKFSHNPLWFNSTKPHNTVFYAFFCTWLHFVGLVG